MMELMRYKPFSGYGRNLDFLKRLFDEGLPLTYGGLTLFSGSSVPAVDIIDKGDYVVLRAEVPGFKREELEILMDGNVLTLKGEKKISKEEETENYYFKESTLGTFTRTITLGTDINKENIKASLIDGILTVDLFKAEAKKPSMVKIEIG